MLEDYLKDHSLANFLPFFRGGHKMAYKSEFGARATEICKECTAILVERNEQYGNSVEWTGVLGAAVECVGMTARLVQLVLRSSKHGRQDPEAVRNALLDLHNYSVIGLDMLSKENWEGKDF